ncbi:MAG: ribbon-helix-helix protein, CopG family [Pseudodesulfovibrio sp.]|uniref:Transcriptional regulator, CopG family n=1 Tax=Pseudodesulfovibrio aespoeensis (strain ATCC 700646 / DSM 10631 / Aspo-2) TaxID=643562 RepID=E6VXQ2_PSEA9|nr:MULTISPECIES: ribbon-helix-helix protein, CopG family [Pseudodesulfovibrio]MBU4377632.1 ribbon-helix-helix protein, CopG family [Pseudomonadota bacterium]ADU61510.1 transcriptional regulator, CopG family [Pseudodesulfovibrio aespoeensis Aspo-2]MBV1763732.1 ribbon-helix-helix protein, CopG family [Pseudodesulfovibrio sp.]MBV1772179.1 ribbon-helix-helix protein, CopG family [Pseudodesulfovibrio sp.]MCG2734389.1 ribbon-helix-helix protein, CopG family [Pseudodesulfovibrio aespoeensis]
MQTTSISARFDTETLSRLDEIAKGLGKSRTAIIKDAVANYLDYDFWFREQVAKGLADLDAGKTVTHDQVKDTIRDMGYNVD